MIRQYLSMGGIFILLLLSCQNGDSQSVDKETVGSTSKKEITSDEYQRWVNSHAVVVVDFSATWCGPCKKLSPLLEKIAERRTNDFKLYTIDVDENPEISQRNEIEVLPTLIWYKNGKMAKRLFGYHDEKEINQMIDDLIK